MDNLSEKFKEIPEEKLPANFRRRVKRKLFFVRFKVSFLVFSALAFAGLLVSGWYLWVGAGEMGTISFINLVFSDYQISGFLNGITDMATDFIPIVPTVAFLLDLILLAFVAKIFLALKKITFNNGRLSF
mgnify:CR=1 FL=1